MQPAAQILYVTFFLLTFMPAGGQPARSSRSASSSSSQGKAQKQVNAIAS
jgi:hypothetical protein